MRKIDDSTFNYIEESRTELALLGEQAKDLLEIINDKINDIIKETTHNDSGLTLTEILDEFRDKKETLVDQVNEVVGDMEGYYDDRSEKWQSGGRGEAYSEWLEAWKYVVYLSEESSIDIILPNSEAIENGDELVAFDIGVTEEFELPSQQPEFE